MEKNKPETWPKLTRWKITLALLGAGGKMGCRLTDHLKDNPAYSLLGVETGEPGLTSLAERGLKPVSVEPTRAGPLCARSGQAPRSITHSANASPAISTRLSPDPIA